MIDNPNPSCDDLRLEMYLIKTKAESTPPGPLSDALFEYNRSLQKEENAKV